MFNIFSVVLLVLFAMGWSWSIARARASGDSSPVTPATANISTALTDGSAPSVAYLTDAALTALAAPARGESGKLRVRIQQPGTPIDQILADTLPTGAVATFSSRDGGGIHVQIHRSAASGNMESRTSDRERHQAVG